MCAPSRSIATLSLTSFTSPPTLSTLASTPFTLSSAVCVALRFCAMTIRASSFVSLSSFFNASTKSVLPANLFRYFSGYFPVNDGMFVYDLLTCPALPDLLCRNPKNEKNFYHDLYHHVHHFRCRWQRSVNFETMEEVFDTFEYINEGFLARAHVISFLRHVRLTTVCAKR